MDAFGKWPYNVEVRDISLKPYIILSERLVPFSQAREQKKFRKTNIVERLINNLMRGGTGRKLKGHVIRDRGGTGKKMKMYIVAKKCFEIINKRTGKNPMEILVAAIENSAPREEVTRVKMGGVTYPIAVDISPQRRIDFALRNIGKAFAMRSFNVKKSAAEALADELILAAKNDIQSHAVARKVEIERISRSAR